MVDQVVGNAPDEAYFAARMTQIQFGALAARLRSAPLLGDIDSLEHFATLRRGSSCELQIVRQWLVNGWSTENLLRINRKHLRGEALSHSLHWIFPQAYYSVYALTMAYFTTIGYTEKTHTTVIRKFGSDALVGRYPPTISFAVSGGKSRQFHHITPLKLPNSLQFDPASPRDCDGRICQFLNATRNGDLALKKGDMKFKNARNQPKKKLTPHEWQKVSDQIGPTSLLSLLYRKRIKANYRDIDAYLSSELDAARLVRDVLQTVLACNLVHELYVARALGGAVLRSCLPRDIERRFPFLAARLAVCEARAA